jgi:hypothetical protein
MSNVIEASFMTTLDIPCERILRKATEADLETVIVIGREKDGELYFASSVADGGDVLWLMEIAKKALLD